MRQRGARNHQVAAADIDFIRETKRHRLRRYADCRSPSYVTMREMRERRRAGSAITSSP